MLAHIVQLINLQSLPQILSRMCVLSLVKLAHLCSFGMSFLGSAVAALTCLCISASAGAGVSVSNYIVRRLNGFVSATPRTPPCEMEEKSKMEEPDADVEKQEPLLLLPPAAISEKPSSGGCEALLRASPTATRTLALVVLVAGAAFTAQLAAREEYALLAVFASQLVCFCLFTSLLALCALPEDGSLLRTRWAVVEVLQWSLAMALPTSMAFWVVQSAPVAVGATLVGLALAVVFACYAELVRALWPAQGPY